MDHAVHGILQVRTLEWWPFPSPGDLPNPGIESRFPTLQVDSLPAESQGKHKNTGVGSLSLLQGIFPTQELNRGLLHCRRILCQLSYQGSLKCALLLFKWNSKMFIDFHLALSPYITYYHNLKANFLSQGNTPYSISWEPQEASPLHGPWQWGKRGVEDWEFVSNIPPDPHDGKSSRNSCWAVISPAECIYLWVLRRRHSQTPY